MASYPGLVSNCVINGANTVCIPAITIQGRAAAKSPTAISPTVPSKNINKLAIPYPIIFPSGPKIINPKLPATKIVPIPTKIALKIFGIILLRNFST